MSLSDALLHPFQAMLSSDPGLRLFQGSVLLVSAIIIFLLFYATRDILQRTHSFGYQFACILLVAVLPVVGFLLYLLIRPMRTLREREMEMMVREMWEHDQQRAPIMKEGSQKDVMKKRILIAKKEE